MKTEINILESGNPTFNTYDHLATASFLTGAGVTQKKSRPLRMADSYKPEEYKCHFCSGRHLAVDYTNTVNPTDRKAIIQREKLCFNCLGKHLANSCRSTHTCKKCKRKHHTSLCDQSNENRSQTSVNALSAEAPSFIPLSHVSQVTNSSTDSSEHSTILHSVTQSRNNVLLKTAVAMVTSGSNSAEANILFDEGAQRSFITRDLADKLNIQRLAQKLFT